MLDWISGALIFITVLFVYLHIQHHLKTSNDLEMYELGDDVDKDRFNEILDMRQPVLFYSEETLRPIMAITNRQRLLRDYPAFDVKIRSSADSAAVNLQLHIAEQLFAKDEKREFMSESNDAFVAETGVQKQVQTYDNFLRPSMLANSGVDIMMGTEGATTPLRYELNFRNFFVVTQGTVTIKLAPPKSARYLHVVKDYVNFEFSSPISPWTENRGKWEVDASKVKFLEVRLNADTARALYIPAFWFYSIRFEEGGASVTNLAYRTFFNNLAISPHYALYGLQISNVQGVIAPVAAGESAAKSDAAAAAAS